MVQRAKTRTRRGDIEQFGFGMLLHSLFNKGGLRHCKHDESIVLRDEYRAKTYLGRHLPSSTRVAVRKIYVSDFQARDVGRMKHIERLFSSPTWRNTQTSLDHPNVLRILECGPTYERLLQPIFYTAFEYVDGFFDRARSHFDIQSRAGLTRNNADLLIDIATGLEELHKRGIVHQYVAPESVFVTSQGRAQITNWGAARSTERLLRPELSSSGLAIPGVLGFMAPEQIGKSKVDRRADIYAFGLLAHLLFSGSNPHETDQVSSRTMHVMRTDLAPMIDDKLKKHSAGIIIARCGKADPGKRYQLMGEVVRDLERLRPILS